MFPAVVQSLCVGKVGGDVGEKGILHELSMTEGLWCICSS